MKKICFFIAVVFSIKALCIPRTTAVHLPVLKDLDSNKEKDVLLAKTLMNLQVYQDSEDKDQYYYVPPFRVFNYEEGSATYVPFFDHWRHLEHAIKAVDELKNPKDELSPFLAKMKEDRIKNLKDSNIATIQYVNDFIGRRNKIIDRENESLDKLKLKYEEAFLSDNQRAVDFYAEQVIKQEHKISEMMSEIKEKEDEIKSIRSEEMKNITSIEQEIAQESRKENAALTRRKLVGAAASLGQTGVDFKLEYPDTPEGNENFLKALSDAVVEGKNTYGGFLSMNIYAGFTQEQVDSIYKYLSKMPHIKLSIMPAKNFTFHPITDTAFSEGNAKHEIALFKKTSGTGNYTGGTLTFDLTLKGAQSMNLALDTFIAPISIRTSVLMKQTPIQGSLVCDFKNVFNFTGRGDVKNGLFFSNDPSTVINSDDETTNICTTTLTSGSLEDAEYQALKEVEKVYSDYNMKRVMLAGEDSKKYFEELKAKFKDMPKDTRTKSEGNWFVNYLTGGWGDIVTGLVSEVSNFYWHTTKENLERVSKVRLEKKFNVQHERIEEMSWPSTICLTFDGHSKKYRRCIEEEEKGMMGISQATNNALSSEECQGAKNAEECAKKRKKAKAKKPKVKAKHKKDNLLI